MVQSNRLIEPRPGTPAEAGEQPGRLDTLLDPALFRALGDPTRARLFACIARCGRGCSVKEVSGCCSVDISVVSRHLSALEGLGVLTREREGRVVRYAACTDRLSGLFRAIADTLDACVREDCRDCGEGDGCC